MTAVHAHIVVISLYLLAIVVTPFKISYPAYCNVNSFKHFGSIKPCKFHINFALRDLIVKYCVDEPWDPFSAPKMNFDEDYYSVLEVKDSSTFAEIKKSFRKIVMKYHPDTKHTKEEKFLTNRQMMVINNAYKFLKDASLRAQYDERRRMGYYGAQSGLPGSGRNPTTTKSKPKTPNTAKPSSTSSTTTTKKTTTEYTRTMDWTKVYQDSSSQDNTYSYNDQNSYTKYSSKTYTSTKNEYDFDETYGSRFFSTNVNQYYNLPIRSLVMFYKEAVQGRDSLFNYLKSDTRDWGEESDSSTIRTRMRDIEMLRRIEKHLEAIKENILDRAYPLTLEEAIRRVESNRYNDSFQRFDPRNPYSYPPQPQTQTQSQMDNNNNNNNNNGYRRVRIAVDDYYPNDDYFRRSDNSERRRGTSDNDGDNGGYKTWRESQRERRRY